MSTISSLKSIENEHNLYRGKDCMKKFCESLREPAMKVINLKKQKMKSLTKEEQLSFENAKLCYLSTEKFQNIYFKDKKYRKIRDHFHYTREYKKLL